MDEKPIHMVKAAFHAQFKTALEDCGISSDAYFRKVGLPTDVSDAENLLPEKPFWNLINTVALLEDITDFGMRVAQVTPWHQVDSLAPLIEDCETLGSLLETFCKLATSQSSAVVFELQRSQSRCWFSYSGETVFKRDVQMELYRITSMIELVQQATGPDWHPGQVRLLMPETRIADHCAVLGHSKITFSNSVSAIAIQPQLLELPVSFTSPARSTTWEQDRSDIRIDFENSIRKIIDSYSPSGQISIDDLARLTDMTVRTLQRRLTTHNLNFKQLLNQARYAHASEQLTATRLPIAEIANSMGYSDAAHFTRAFRRWAGVTPSAYRKQRAN